MTVTTVAQALEQARLRGLDRLDACLLLGHALQRSRTWLLAHGESPLGAGQSEAWQALAERRTAGEPLAYILGCKDFHALTLQIGPAVLIPRPETELLVERALALLRRWTSSETRPRLVDLGTGSGAIALACKAGHPLADVCASDASAAALAVARDNAARLDLPIEFGLGSWWQAWSGVRFDIAVSNPPYVAEGDAHLAVLGYEPALALTAGVDGLAALREIVRGAADHLNPGGWLWLEHGFDQAEAVRAMLATAGFIDVSTDADLAGQPRCSGGRR